MKFNFEATAIGSLPLKDPKTACHFVLDTFKHIPFWPQLPKRTFLENMYVQYAECLPGLVIDEKHASIHVDSVKAKDCIQELYEKYLAADIDYCKISKTHAAGFYQFLEQAKKPHKDMLFVKGHVTGPASFALSVADEHKQSIIYDCELFEVVTKMLTMKARWQIRKLKDVCPNVIIFIDEPYLVSIGSSYVNINVTEVAGRLDEVAGAIKAEGALCGMHCCGNTDWKFILSRDIDIVSFDAYNFTKEFVLYGEEIKAFLAKGGTIAWGIVPSSDAIDAESERTLTAKLKASIASLVEKGVDTASMSALVTPSCGVGSLDETRAKKVMQLTAAVAAAMKV